LVKTSFSQIFNNHAHEDYEVRNDIGGSR